MGTERDKRRYDHSREGPLLDSTCHGLRGEMMSMEQASLAANGIQDCQELSKLKILAPK